jgi:hypothetical protein
MNKRNLALLISKHPLMRKLTEDKTIPKSIVARLILEELMEAQSPSLRSALAGIRRDFNKNKQEKYMDPETNQAVYPYAKLDQLSEEEKGKYKEAVNKKIEAFLAQQSPDTKAQGEKQEREVDAAINKEIDTPQDTEDSSDVVDTVTANTKEKIDDNQVDQEDMETVVAAEIEQVAPEAPEEQKAEIANQVLTNLSNSEEKPIEFSDKQKEKFISAATNFEQEFYNQKLLRDQAKLISAVIDSIKDLQDDPELAKSFGRNPKPVPVAENQQKIKANQEELQNLRVDFRSFLQRVNSSSKVLVKFETAAEAGKIISDKYKKQFMKILSELQKSIQRIVRDLQQILPQEDLTEAKEPGIMNKWDEVEKRYDLALQSVNGLKELINGVPSEEKPEEVINDTFRNLIDLSQDFPSVNPFNVGVKTPADFVSYKESFKSAVAGVKSSIQNVLSLIKSSVGGEDSLRLAMSGLKEFSGQIQSIFGVASQFKDVQVQPNEEAAKEVSPGDQPAEERRGDDSKTIPIHRETEEYLKEKGIPEEIREKMINAAEAALEEFSKDNLDQTEIIKNTTEKVMSDLDPDEQTIVSARLSTPEEKREPTAILYKSMQDDSDTLVKEKNLEQVLDSKIEKLQEEFSSEERKYTDAYAQAIFKFFLNKNKIGNKDNPKYKSDFLVRARNQADAANRNLQEREVNVTSKLGLSPEEQKEVRALLPQDQLEWVKNYRTSTNAKDWFYDHKEEFGELVLLVLDRKILKHFEAEGMPQSPQSSTPSIQETFGLTAEEMEAMEKFKKHLSSLREALKMTGSDREKYTKYLKSLSKEDRKHFSTAMKKIGSLEKQSDFRKWLGFDEPDETKTYKKQRIKNG